jgi:proton glutamate symport protein
MRGLLSRYLSLSLATRILIWMTAGAVLGLILGEKMLWIQPVGEIFLRLLILAAIPLVICNLLAGIAAVGDIKTFGKIGSKIMGYYVLSTAFAITVGLTIMSLYNAGKGFELTGEPDTDLGTVPNLVDIIMDMIPSNVFSALSEGNLIQIVIFTTLLGFATLYLPKDLREKFSTGYEYAAELMRSLVELILRMSPLGLGALMAATMAEYGSQILGPLTLFIVAIYTAQIAMIIFYMLILYTVGRVRPLWFLNKTRDLYATTVATCSSLASLAVSLDIAETQLKLPKKVFSFTLPLGAQFNKDGTSIMLAGILIFTAQAAGINLSAAEMVQVVIVGLILSEGSGGIPGGGLVIAMLFAEAFSLPLEIVAIVGGIYRLIDMGNTTVNCMGDMMATTVISRLDTDWRPEYEKLEARS